jgi:hypothetical protein
MTPTLFSAVFKNGSLRLFPVLFYGFYFQNMRQILISEGVAFDIGVVEIVQLLDQIRSTSGSCDNKCPVLTCL